MTTYSQEMLIVAEEVLSSMAIHISVDSDVRLHGISMGPSQDLERLLVTLEV